MSEEKIKDEIYKLENKGLEVSDEVIGFYYKDWEKFKEAIKQGEKVIQKKNMKEKLINYFQIGKEQKDYLMRNKVLKLMKLVYC